jgi:hypothetical protein
VVGPVPMTSPNFHGDTISSEIAVIGTYSKLRDEGTSSLIQHALQQAFQWGLSYKGLLIGLGSLLFDPHRILFAPSCGVCGRDLLFPSFGAPHLPFDSFGLDSASFTNPIFNEDSLYGTAADAQHLTDGYRTKTGVIFVDDVNRIEGRYFCGHVYNLETEDHLIIAQGVVTHNCRCTTTPVLKSWRELGVNLKEAPDGTRASMDGQISETDNYASWLEKQSAAIQDEALGKTRGALFRRGELSFDRFTDQRGNQLTLDQLREREAKAFNLANLEE